MNSIVVLVFCIVCKVCDRHVSADIQVLWFYCHYKTRMNVANLLTCALPFFLFLFFYSWTHTFNLAFILMFFKVTSSTFLVFSRSQRKIGESGSCAGWGAIFVYQYLHRKQDPKHKPLISGWYSTF